MTAAQAEPGFDAAVDALAEYLNGWTEDDSPPHQEGLTPREVLAGIVRIVLDAARVAPAGGGYDVVGRVPALKESLLRTWLAIADASTWAAPAEHLDAMLHDALRSGVLRPVDGKTTDGFHSFDELYRHRLLLNAALFNQWGSELDTLARYDVHKSLLHHDGEVPFGGGWFIVMATLPTGQVSWHYQLEHWDLFDVPEVSRAAVFDGHTSQEAADRIQRFLEDRVRS